MKNLYEVLGVANFSNIDELKRRYHQLALQYHPDKQHNNDSDMFQCVNEAWKVLQDDKLKMEYDVQLSEYLLQSSDNFIHDSFTVEEVTTYWDITDDNEYMYDCRCGGVYAINCGELSHLSNDITLSCESCSLLITITT